MKFQAFGGAQEIGASCYLLEIDGRHILIDCGVRNVSGFGSQSPIPDLEHIEAVDAICITHTHLDHVGALPLALKRFRKALCFMTAPTFLISSLVMRDFLRRIERDFLFIDLPEPLVQDSLEVLINRTLTAGFHQKFLPFERTPLSITFLCAGHILGAAGILIEGEEGRVLFTGDFTILPQRTVPSADFSCKNLDLLVTETTYGNSAHQKRQLAEETLLGVIRETLLRGGKVLIPTFAVGRAQEVLLLLEEGQALGKIPQVPIFIDGLVLDVCGLYETMIKPRLFFEERRNNLIRVRNPDRRSSIISGDPCIIVASSGQLVGVSASVIYATGLLPDPKNSILLVSFQDEESPGRMLMRLKPGGSIILGENRVTVNAQIRHASLSAHPDADQLVNFTLQLNPRSVIGIHGGPEETKGFATRLSEASFGGRIFTPSNGEVLKM